jgi:hypothetical protein
LNFQENIPYPFIYGRYLEEYYDLIETRKLRQRGEERAIKEVKGNFINPYAVGYKINHPPPN